MKHLARIAAAVLLLVAVGLLPSVAAAAEPNLADLCSLMPAGVTVWSQPPGFCMASSASQSGPSIQVSIGGPRANADADVQDKLDRVMPLAAQVPTDAYGDEAYEGGDNLVYESAFRRDAYIVTVFGWTGDESTVHGYALEIDSNLQVALTNVPGPTDSPIPSASAGVLQLGLACAADLQVVRCTVSTFGAAAGAELQYTWLFDGDQRPETGSTMELSWVVEGVRTGNHFVLVLVHDARNNADGSAVTSFDLGLSVRVACDYVAADGAYTVSCTATPGNAFATAVLVYQWSYTYFDGTGQVRNGQDGSTDERFSRSFGRGAVTVTVVARDTANNQQSSAVSANVVIDPASTLTEMLTLGETADPQNVIDAAKGAAAGVAATSVAIVAALIGGAAAGGAGSGTKRGPGGPGGPGGRPSNGGGPSPGATKPAPGAVQPGDPFVDAANMIDKEPWELGDDSKSDIEDLDLHPDDRGRGHGPSP